MKTSKVIEDSTSGHIESEDCWCHPSIEVYPNGVLVIHNEPAEC